MPRPRETLRPLRLLLVILAGCVALALPAGVRAEEVPAVQAPGAATETSPQLPPAGRGQAVEAGLLAGRTAALGTGQTVGLFAGWQQAGPRLGWGARLSWSQATEHTLTWAVTHDELRLRAVGSLRGEAGRGTWHLRLGLGATVVYESRERHQSARLTESGLPLTESAWGLLPAGDLELGVTLRLAGAWAVVVAGGPSAHLLDGAVEPGWSGTVGAAWLP